MKRSLPIVALFILGFALTGQSQDPVVIIDEDFQTWPATEGVKSDPPDSCEKFNHIAGPDEYNLTYLTGGAGKVTLIKYLISPECNTKRVNQGEFVENAEGVTTGFIGLTKTAEEGDTIGQMFLPQLSNVTKIEFGYSCTSSSRGIRLYTSTDGGYTWEGPWTDAGPGIGEIIGSDTKLGEYVVLDINRDDVILKFTSGVDTDGISQNSRIHNIKVWGVPGSKETGIGSFRVSKVKAYYTPGAGLVIEGRVNTLRLYDMTGRVVLEKDNSGNQTLDISHLSNGVYIIKGMDLNSNPFAQKFMKN